MRTTRVLMGMPITVEIVSEDEIAAQSIEDVFAYFTSVDERFSMYKNTSEIMRINHGTCARADASPDMQEVFALCERTRDETDGYFNHVRGDCYDPTGVVKGWAIHRAAELLRRAGHTNFFIDAGGDSEIAGHNADGEAWRVGIRNPFCETEVVKILHMSGGGIATSGTSMRGQHIYNPHAPEKLITDIVSMTVVGPDVCSADRFATAAFAMGTQGITFIDGLAGHEGYMIDARGCATMTRGFETYVQQN